MSHFHGWAAHLRMFERQLSELLDCSSVERAPDLLLEGTQPSGDVGQGFMRDFYSTEDSLERQNLLIEHCPRKRIEQTFVGITRFEGVSRGFEEVEGLFDFMHVVLLT